VLTMHPSPARAGEQNAVDARRDADLADARPHDREIVDGEEGATAVTGHFQGREQARRPVAAAKAIEGLGQHVGGDRGQHAETAAGDAEHRAVAGAAARIAASIVPSPPIDTRRSQASAAPTSATEPILTGHGDLHHRDALANRPIRTGRARLIDVPGRVDDHPERSTCCPAAIGGSRIELTAADCDGPPRSARPAVQLRAYRRNRCPSRSSAQINRRPPQSSELPAAGDP